MYPELTEAERFPLLTPRGRELLYRMRQHPHAPIWNWPNGEQLDEAGLHRVHSFAKSLNDAASRTNPSDPDWLFPYVERCLREVPFYRKQSRPGTPFQDIPTFSRADLAPRVWEFVPDSMPLDQTIVFSSSGTTGYPTRTPHHPYSAACGVPLIEFALRSLHGIELPRGPENVAITNIAAYPGAFTTTIVVAYLQEAGCVRVNLHPSAWRSTNDRARYIDEWQAPIWLGDPVAFEALETIDVGYSPKAIISSIMHLSDAYATRLGNRYGCPVLDLYAMTEAGIIAVRTHEGHRILPHDLHVEILDADDQQCAPGVHGEITLTGGRNPFLPLLRYRTGDFAALEVHDQERLLVNFHGREQIEYRTSSGLVIHSMEVTRLMRRHPVLRYEMKQRTGGGFELYYDGDIDSAKVRIQLEELFGEAVGLLQKWPRDSARCSTSSVGGAADPLEKL